MNKRIPPASSKLIVALDLPTCLEALAMARTLSPVVSTFKIGYWLLLDRQVRTLISYLKREGKQVFIDAKVNDIPETVKHAVASAGRSGGDFITVHSDAEMLQAAMDGKGESDIKVMAVTALTSLAAAGSRERFRAGVMNAMIANCDGMIMSPADLTDPVMDFASENVRAGQMIIATPGVRLPGTWVADHQRSGTPAQAIKNGAKYIIVGRPIVREPDPLAAAQAMIAAIDT